MSTPVIKHRILITPPEAESATAATVPAPGSVVSIEGEEAHHALRSKRLETGEWVELLDGRGNVIAARIAGARKSRDLWIMDLKVETVTSRVAPSPRVEVFAPPPKGDRLEEMIDQLSQVGAAAYTPLVTARTVVEPRPTKLERLQRVAGEALKQCGRAWMLEIRPPMTFARALQPAPDTMVLLADATGTPDALARLTQAQFAAQTRRVLIGPEGGFSPDELAQADAAGVTRVNLGPHILRIETAAVVAAATLHVYNF